jgi:hypothetical protein
MNEEKNLAVAPSENAMVIEGLSLDQAQKQFKNLQQFVRSQMRQDVDFGIIPGCKKPSLWKSGAERLLFFHGLGCKLDSTPGTIENWESGFFNFSYRATVYNPRTQAVIATAEGSCNSKEAKYAYIWVTQNKVPRGMKVEDLVNKEVNGQNGKFLLYRLDNPDPFSLHNTISKMAQKRAMIAATLVACRASDIFTQDETTEPEDVEEKATENKAADPAESSSAPRVMSDSQRKLVYARWKAAGLKDSDVEDMLSEQFPYTVKDGKAHTSLIRADDMAKILEWIKSQGK